MKLTLSILLLIFSYSSLMGQNTSTVNAEVRQKIFQEIEKEIVANRLATQIDKMDKLELEFYLDTFRIERFMEKCISLDNSDFGMGQSAYEAAKQYDVLLNKYYQKLLSKLTSKDRAALTQAQKSWLTFRDNEFKLIQTLGKTEYSGGGTMQQSIESGQYLNLVKTRTIALFDHFQRTEEIE